MPMGMITSAPPSSMSARAWETKFCTISSRFAAISGKEKPTLRIPAILDSISIAPRHCASGTEWSWVVDDEAKTVAQERGDMKTGFERSDYRNIDGRLAAIDAEVEHAQRNHRVIALALGFSKGFDKRRRGHLDIRRAHAANVRRGGR